MPPEKSPKNSNSAKNGRISKKLDEVLRVCSKLSDEQQLMRKKMKKKDRQIFRLISLLEESRNPPEQPIAGFLQSSCSCRLSESSGLRRRLQLSFVCKMPNKLFTTSLIYAIDDGTKAKNVPLRVVLLDEDQHVMSEGPLSSLELEVFVAYGDFKADDKEVEASRVPARKDKGSLLLGSCEGAMVNGSCTFNGLKFGDNSSWVPSKTFRLVAKVAEKARIPDMVEIRPAISEAFRVKDQRGKQYEKHPVPSRGDEVWRIRRIGKDGPYHKRLEDGGVRTVEEFLQRYYMDQSSLRKILGAKDGVWATIVEHAMECKPNNEGFLYDSHGSKVKLVFDCFYKLVGVSFDDQSYCHFQDLTEDDKSQVEQVRLGAFEDRTKLVRINSVSGIISAKSNLRMVLDPNPQHPVIVDPPPQQVESTMEFVPEVEDVPQESIWANVWEGGENKFDGGRPASPTSVLHADQIDAAIDEDDLRLWDGFYHDSLINFECHLPSNI